MTVCHKSSLHEFGLKYVCKVIKNERDMNAAVELTENETQVLKSIVNSNMWGEKIETSEGRQVPFSEIDFPFNGKKLSGVLSSLNSKGIVSSDAYDVVVLFEYIEFAKSL